MAFLPEIHVNLEQLTFERIYQLFLPLIPGSTLVGGLMFAKPASVFAVSSALGLGRYSRFAVLLCVVYIVGFVLYGFSIWMVGNCTVLLNYVVYKKWPPKRPNETSSKSFVWRRVAAELLGASLIPPTAQLPLPPLSGNDVEWQDLYNILQDYALRNFAVVPKEVWTIFMYFQATGWALLYLYLRTPLRGHWSVLVVSIALIFLGITFPFGNYFFYWKYDRLTAWDFTARLINEIKMRERSTTAPPQQP